MDLNDYQLVWSDDFDYEGRPDPEKWTFDKPFYLILNTAVGGGLGGPVSNEDLPFEFEIEYVHVYQKKH